jgi:hypothetical protein
MGTVPRQGTAGRQGGFLSVAAAARLVCPEALSSGRARRGDVEQGVSTSGERTEGAQFVYPRTAEAEQSTVSGPTGHLDNLGKRSNGRAIRLTAVSCHRPLDKQGQTRPHVAARRPSLHK